jgi:sirohydrochlorin cobaltochelatase
MPEPSDLVVLIGHGTRLPAGQEEFRELVRRARARLPMPVEAGFIEFAEPDLSQLADRAVAQRAPRVTVAPVVLVGAGHLKDDAASVAARIAERSPGSEVRLAGQLGAATELLALAEARARAARPDTPDAIVVVGRGSTDPSANAELAAIARLLGERLGVDLSEEAFVSLARPGVSEVLRRVARLGAERITLVPWWLFAGLLLERAYDEARDTASSLGLDLALAERFGPDDAVLAALWLNIEDAWRHVRTSCDTCRWRPPFAPPPPPTSRPPARIEIGIAAGDETRLGAFWARIAGYAIGDLDREGTYLDLVPPRPELPVLFVQRTHEPPPANRVHLDLYVEDLEAARERVLALGGTQHSDLVHGSEGGSWYVMADPEGTLFCLMGADSLAQPEAPR